VGDQTNDPVRIDATQLRARVVGEGGNLGLTQRARVEYALAGGAINTDAIDNSAGVDTSDHEVNLKILLSALMQAGHIDNLVQRNAVLHSLAPEVAELVLADNRSQSLILSLDQRKSSQEMGLFLNWMQFLSKSGFLDRRTEALSTNAQLQDLAKQGKGMTRPDLAVLLSYTKLYAYQELLASPLLQGDAWDNLYLEYYPASLKTRFNPLAVKHPLQHEITCNLLLNRVLNQAGITLIEQVNAVADRGVAEVFAAYWVLEQALQLPALRRAIFTAPGRPLEEVYSLWIYLESVLAEILSQHLLQEHPLALSLTQQARLGEALSLFFSLTPPVGLPDKITNRLQAPLEEPIALGLARLETAKIGLHLISFAQALGQDLAPAWLLWNLLEADFGFAALRQGLLEAAAESQWEAKHKRLLVQDSFALQTALGKQVLSLPGSLEAQYHAFRKAHADALNLLQNEMQAFLSNQGHQLSAISVIFAQLRAVFA